MSCGYEFMVTSSRGHEMHVSCTLWLNSPATSGITIFRGLIDVVTTALLYLCVESWHNFIQNWRCA